MVRSGRPFDPAGPRPRFYVDALWGFHGSRARRHDAILLFHNLEWIASFENPVGDYNLNTDAGVRATIIGTLLDVRYLLSLGWTF
jgi:hypothetical protein